MAHRKLEHIVSLSPTEIASIKRVIDASSLTEVHIEQRGERIVIGGAAPAKAPKIKNPVTVPAPAAGTISLGAVSIGQRVAEGEWLAGLHVLDRETPITASASGRIAAIFVNDGELAAYGADLLLIEPEETR